MDNLLTKMIYLVAISSIVSIVLALPVVIIAIFTGIVSWISGFSFGWMFSIGVTSTFLITIGILNNLYREIEDFRVDLDLTDEEDML